MFPAIFAANGQASARGTVRTPEGTPAPNAVVDAYTDSASTAHPIASVATDSIGRFALVRLPRQQLWLRARRIGFGPVVEAVDLRARDAAGLVLTLRSARELRAAAGVASHRERVAEFHARRGPRRWYCPIERPYADTVAAKAFTALVHGMRGVIADYDVPQDSTVFVKAFLAPLTSRECRRLAQGLDRAELLESAVIEAYRFGRVVLLPRYGFGAFATPDGRMLTVFVVAD